MVVEKAYAKINLGLEVLNKREDSYHDLAMIMTSISLSDELYFEEIDQNKIIIDCEKMSHIVLESNLIYIAAKLIKERFEINKGVKIRVVKNIPEKAGLGGGSADAAATLRGLNTLWNLGQSLDDLAKLAIEIGSDVPFCIYNKTAKVTGRGENIEFIADVPYLNLLLVFPHFKASTKDVFNSFRIHGRNRGKLGKLISAIKTRDIDDISNNLFNDLEYSYFYKDIVKIKADLIASGAKGAVMTGSGSTVFAICLNEKDARNVQNRFSSKNRSANIMLVQTRSNLKYTWSGQARTQTKYKTLDTIKTKVYAYIPLAYQKINDEHIEIKTPINISNEITIEKINHKISEVYVNEYKEEGKLSDYLEKLVSKLDYGLRIKINESLYKGFDLFSSENYLAQIINALTSYNEDIDKLFNLYNNKVKAYRKRVVYYYESSKDNLDYLNDVPFGHVLITDLGIKKYKNPRYTKQIVRGEEIDNILEAIEEKNFYKVSENLYNSLSKFEIRNIEENSKLKVSKIRSDCFKHGASGFLLSVDGRSIICLMRYEKHLKAVRKALENFHNLRRSIITTILSTVSHQVSESKVLTEIVLPEREQIITPDFSLFEKQQEESYDYSSLDYDDYSSPFDDDLDLDDLNRVGKQVKPKVRKPLAQTPSNKDIEGILHIHSGGSLFKFYDFVDIARYFEKYFHNKQIEFEINNEKYVVGFKVNHLPHLLGIHKIDPNDESLKGIQGYEKLINGSISYKKLKNKLDQKVFNQINTRTQGSVLIFNDIYHGRDKEFICYDKDVIFKEDSYLREKVRYGITRGVARNRFHKRNVLGIGYEESSNISYFITSFLWEAQADLGKKEGYRVKIVKH